MEETLAEMVAALGREHLVTGVVATDNWLRVMRAMAEKIIEQQAQIERLLAGDNNLS